MKNSRFTEEQITFAVRHTWAHCLVQQGTPTNVLQKLGAWESEGMVRGYAQLAPAQFVEHAERIPELLGGTHSARPANGKSPNKR